MLYEVITATDRRRALEREIAMLGADDGQIARAELGVIAQRVRIAYHAIRNNFV